MDNNLDGQLENLGVVPDPVEDSIPPTEPEIASAGLTPITAFVNETEGTVAPETLWPPPVKPIDIRIGGSHIRNPA